MATSKTLTPTNQTISIPELSDAPDMSVPADAIDKEADAINSLNSKTSPITNGIALDSNVDLNDYTDVGFYTVSGASKAATISNIPSTETAGVLCVYPNGRQTDDTTIRRGQMYTTLSSDPKIFIRNLTNSGWTTWKEFAGKDDKMDVQPCGSWNGNQSVESLKTAVTQTGLSIAYLQDATYGNGWSLVTSKVDGSYKFITIYSPTKIIYAYTTTGTSWGVSSCALS